MLSSKNFSRISLVLVVLFVTLALKGVRPGILGDGLEYSLMSHALLDHGAPNITPGDLSAVQSYAGDAGTNVPAIASRNTVSSSPPFYKDGNGRYYSYHFWLYSVFVAPFYFLIRLLGGATPWAFVALNLVSALVASGVIYTWRGVEREQRLLLLTLFWSCGTIPYIGWTHPEVFCASLLVISIVMALSRKYVIAAFVAAIAAQQNPPILFLVAFVLILDFCANIIKTKSIVPSFWKFAGWLACVAMGSLSIAFFFIHFKTGSLIAHSGFAKSELISLGRLWSFYFDFNQGAIVLLWPLLIIVPALLICGFAGAGLRAASLGISACLVCASLALAVPSLSATNFNSGASFILRYAYWSSIPLLFAVTVLCAGDSRSRMVVYLGVVVFSLFNVWCYSGSWPSYVYYSPLAKKIMGAFPDAYNPVPEIFVERGQHRDWSMRDQNIYYYADNGVVRKILVNPSYRSVAEFRCSNGVPVRNYVTSISRAELGWTYFNLKPGCVSFFGDRGVYESPSPIERGTTLTFDSTGNGGVYLGSGWSSAESWGTWSAARESSIVLPLNTTDVTELSLNVNAFLNGRHPVQPVDILVNDVKAGSVVLSAGNDNRFSIRIPDIVSRDLRQSKVLRLNFRFDDPVSPRDLGVGDDERMLVMGLISLTIR